MKSRIKEPTRIVCNDPERGSTLVELIIGAVVSLVLISAVLTVVVQQGHQRQSATESSLAMSAASNILEQMRTLQMSSLKAMHGKGFDVPGVNGSTNGLHAVPGDVDGRPGRLSVVVEQSTASAVLYRVIAIVRWRGVNGDQTLRFSTLISERK